MAKPKVAFYWCAGCGGCEEAVVDLAEDILKVVEQVDIVFWPVALDFKLRDVEAMADGELAVSFINGAVRTDEQLRMARLLRQKSGLVVAFGSCAHLGGIPGLGNFWDRETIFKSAYLDSPFTDNPEGTVPQEMSAVKEGELTLPAFWDTVKSLGQVIDVDYYLPGCAPTQKLIMEAVGAILSGRLPQKGAVLSPGKSLCDGCSRKGSKPDRMSVREIRRPHLTDMDQEKCFLDQGLICLGPATRGGCEGRCISANMPCRGCFGPTDRVRDQGGKMLSALASIIDAKDEDGIRRVMDTIADPAGTFYRFSLPTSLLHRRVIP